MKNVDLSLPVNVQNSRQVRRPDVHPEATFAPEENFSHRVTTAFRTMEFVQLRFDHECLGSLRIRLKVVRTVAAAPRLDVCWRIAIGGDWAATTWSFVWAVVHFIIVTESPPRPVRCIKEV